MTVTCRVLKLARQPYYRWLAEPITASEVVGQYRANALFDAHRDDPEFGHRLLADDACNAGEAMADRTAWRITAVNGWWSVFGKKRGKNGEKPGPAVHDDLCTVTDENGRVRHEFTASTPNELWLAGYPRAQDLGGQALSLRHQGRLRQQDRRLVDRFQDEVKPGRPSTRERRSDAR